MKSMTGYGKGEAEDENGRKVSIELKTVNNRYLDINTRLPRALQFCDDIVRGAVQRSVKRGTADVFFSYENRAEGNKEITVDWALAGAYVKASEELCEKFCLAQNDFGAAALMRAPDMIKIEYAADDPELIGQLAAAAAEKAAAELDKMRETEGAAIKADLTALAEALSDSLKAVESRAPEAVCEYRIKIEARMRDILKAVEVDEAKLLNETAFFADKADVHEEISRLWSHIGQFNACLNLSEPQGRKLDFIAQEMNREINTIGSKSNDVEISNRVIAMKNGLEKLKEQIRNVE